MSRNLIMIPFAYDDEHMASCFKSDEKSKRMYFECVCVSCLSAKKNGNSDVALVTNIDVPAEYRHLLEKNEVQIIKLDFKDFRFETDQLWYLAFYKLNALYHVSRMLDYDNFCYLDTDVYVQHDFDPIWKECAEHIMMYDINHGLQVNDYRIIVEEFSQYFGERKCITHFGGEFFAASRKNAIAFSATCLEIFQRMCDEKITTTKGDEYIISIAAFQHTQSIKNAGAYVYRFWSGTFYLVSTNYRYNPVCVLHMPAEKGRGIARIYHYIASKSDLPKNTIVWKCCHLRRQPLAFFLLGVIRNKLK